MINDPTVVADIQASWATVRMIQARIRTTLNAGIFSLVPAATNLREIPDSLLLVFSLSAIEGALNALVDQGTFQAPNRKLGTLMHSSRAVIPWRDFAAVDAARE